MEMRCAVKKDHFLLPFWICNSTASIYGSKARKTCGRSSLSRNTRLRQRTDICIHAVIPNRRGQNMPSSSTCLCPICEVLRHDCRGKKTHSLCAYLRCDLEQVRAENFIDLLDMNFGCFEKCSEERKPTHQDRYVTPQCMLHLKPGRLHESDLHQVLWHHLVIADIRCSSRNFQSTETIHAWAHETFVSQTIRREIVPFDSELNREECGWL